MSRADIKTIKCKKCGSEFRTWLWDSINVTVDPEFKEKILKEEINFGFCPKCRAPYKIIAPFLYHDMDRKLMVWVRLEEERPQKEEFLKQLKKMMEEEFKIGGNFAEKGYIYGVAFGINELKEKLRQAGEWSKEELKLCTKERGSREFIATISVKNNEVIIETEDVKIRDDLFKEISRLNESGGIFVFEHEFQDDNYALLGGLTKPQDSYFLYALKNSSYLWRSDKKYGEHVICGFCSVLVPKIDKETSTVKLLRLGEALKNPANQKYDIKIYEYPQKDKDYRKYVLGRVVRTTQAYLFQKSMMRDRQSKWDEYYFESINMDKGFINDYAKSGPTRDFLESVLAYEEDEEILRECNIDKYNFIKELIRKT